MAGKTFDKDHLSQFDKVKEITDKLEQGVAEIFTSDRYREMLDMFAKFPEYSANNALLILLQKPILMRHL
jgi:hypothetical protein